MSSIYPVPGDVFEDKYVIERVIGRGGYSRVYLATQTELGRKVALKLVRPTHSIEDTLEEREARVRRVLTRFEREAKLASQLRDPHTVMLHDFGQAESGLLYMCMEYVDGQTLDDLLGEEGSLKPERVVIILRRILSSLQEAHHLGVLHRDIKPSNIMVFEHAGRRDWVKVLDFGMAKLLTGERTENITAEHVLVGTPRYMSPEQVRSEDLSPASDIYSLGLVAWELLVGEQAIQHDDLMAIVARHLDPNPIELPESINVPPAFRHTLQRMLEKDAEARYQSADDVIASLDHWFEDFIISEVEEVSLDELAQPAVDESPERRQSPSRERTTSIMPEVPQAASKEASTAEGSRVPWAAVVLVGSILVLGVVAIGFVATRGESVDATPEQPVTSEPQPTVSATSVGPGEESVGEGAVDTATARTPDTSSGRDDEAPQPPRRHAADRNTQTAAQPHTSPDVGELAVDEPDTGVDGQPVEVAATDESATRELQEDDDEGRTAKPEEKDDERRKPNRRFVGFE